MKRETAINFFIVIFFLCISSATYAQIFNGRVDLGLIESNQLTEASGIAASRKNVGVLWAHNDSGDSNRIYAFNQQGTHLGIYAIAGATNRDWEDIAVGPGPINENQYIYIGDIGDNNGTYNLKYVYRILEPNVSGNQNPKDTLLSNVDKITFQYPDGKRDAETLMVDPLTKDIYIVSKREDSVRVYLLKYPQSLTQTITALNVVTLSLKGGQNPPQSYTVGGDIAHNGLEITIKTMGKIYYWSRNPGQSLTNAFSSLPITLPYIEEPQGEAISWSPDARGYYTISEETGGMPAHLYFYPRIDEPLSYQSIILDASIEGFYNENMLTPDTVTVQLRSISSPFMLIEEIKIFLDSLNHGVGKFTRGQPGKLYYLVLKHRNSIETWSSVGQQFSLAALNFNFTQAQNYAFGSNLVLKGTKWCIYSGDVNQDGIIDLSDLLLIDNDNLNFITGYFATDINGDGIVDITDLNLCSINAANFISKIIPTTIKNDRHIIK